MYIFINVQLMSVARQDVQDIVHLLHQMTAAVAAVMRTHHLLAVVVALQPPVAHLVKMRGVAGRHIVKEI